MIYAAGFAVWMGLLMISWSLVDIRSELQRVADALEKAGRR